MLPLPPSSLALLFGIGTTTTTSLELSFVIGTTTAVFTPCGLLFRTTGGQLTLARVASRTVFRVLLGFLLKGGPLYYSLCKIRDTDDDERRSQS